MVPPSGTTAERPQNPQKGTLRFNTDIGSLEYFKGDTLGWESINRVSPNLNGGARGLFTIAGSPSANIDMVTIATLGNSTDWADLNTGAIWGGGIGSRVRGVCGGRYNNADNIQYGYFSQQSNFLDFGNLTDGRHQMTALSNNIRGCFIGGTGPAKVDTIDYITISQTGNAVDFGNLLATASFNLAVSSPVRGVIGGGFTPTIVNTIQYITVMTTGNAAEFGDLTSVRAYGGQACNATRGIFAGGQSPNDNNPTNVIDYVTMATTGNSVDFGDLIAPMGNQNTGVVSSPTRGLFANGYDNPVENNVISYITIPTLGNAVDFGDTTSATSGGMAMSNAHGGL